MENQTQESKYGPSNFDGGGAGPTANHLKIKSGEPGQAAVTIFRLAPSMGEQRKTGTLFVYEPIHWGYYGVDRRDLTKAQARTFVCPRERDFDAPGEYLVDCAECVLIKEMSDERENICPTKDVKKDVRLASRAKLTPEARERLRVIDEFLDGRDGQGMGSHKIDSKVWKWNAYSETEQKAGDIKFSSNVHYQIKARKRDERDPEKQGIIDKYLAKRWDAISPTQGLWLKVTRIGNGAGMGTAKDKVEVVMEPIDPNDISKGEKFKPAPIVSGGPIDLALDTCRDLMDCSPSTRLTSAQVARLVALYRENRNSPEAVDEIFDEARAEQRAARTPPKQQNFREGPDEGTEKVFAQPAQSAPAMSSAQQPATVQAAQPAVQIVSTSPPAAAATSQHQQPLTPEEEAFLATFRNRQK